jgi:hypothetical protein
MRNLGQVSRRYDFEEEMRNSYLSGEALGFSEIFSARPKQVKLKWLRCGSLNSGFPVEKNDVGES